MDLLQSPLAFKSLDGKLLDYKDQKLWLTAMNYSNVETLSNQMKHAS